MAEIIAILAPIFKVFFEVIASAFITELKSPTIDIRVEATDIDIQIGEKVNASWDAILNAAAESGT